MVSFLKCSYTLQIISLLRYNSLYFIDEIIIWIKRGQTPNSTSTVVGFDMKMAVQTRYNNNVISNNINNNNINNNYYNCNKTA